MVTFIWDIVLLLIIQIFQKYKFEFLITILFFFKMSEKQKVVISIDTEFESSNIINGNCLQLAFVVILDNPDYDELNNSESWILETLSLCFNKQEDKKTEENTTNWWKGFPEILERIKSESKDIKDSMNELQLFLNRIYSKYEVIGFLSDISSVDMPWFRNLYLIHCDQSKNTFQLPWKCKCLENMIETLVLLGIEEKEIEKFCKNEKYPHTHYAMDDAIECGYFYLRLKLFMKQFKLQNSLT